MSLVNGLCISVLEDAYHFSLTSSPSTDVSPSTTDTSIPFSLASNSLDETLQLLKSTFAYLNPDSQTIFCRPTVIRTVHLRTIMSIVTKLGLPSLNTEPIPFYDAYSATLSVADLPRFILFIECSFGESVVEVIEFIKKSNGDFFTSPNYSFSHQHSATEDISAVAEEVARLLVTDMMDMRVTPTRIVIFGPPLALTKAVQGRLTTTHPSIPVHIVSPNDLSKGAANTPPPDPDACRVRVMATYGLIIPISIETAEGGAVVALPSGLKLRPAKGSILLTTSVDNQTSVTVRILLGNHAKAEDNLLSGTVVLEGLTLKAKGEVVIRVSFVIWHVEGATVTVEQVTEKELGITPRKVVPFPDSIRYLY
ncbi:hypothetical protein M413DRAFT_124270 [Hebeloma cylindrosporum]|uniref:Uncharacterized protein n=1 Tax=Hebeloma cylindrosporum TaxID=76867 RepID=A0A0C3CGS7_HEBCY|nr:hypothetical protein M413DRAFT_124270 [Hebeloma cylindrosporum h7]